MRGTRYYQHEHFFRNLFLILFNPPRYYYTLALCFSVSFLLSVFVTSLSLCLSSNFGRSFALWCVCWLQGRGGRYHRRHHYQRITIRCPPITTTIIRCIAVAASEPEAEEEVQGAVTEVATTQCPITTCSRHLVTRVRCGVADPAGRK